ncbi:MAG: ABC transporter ATP-binding protein [Gammaproteobacteria bacterium]|nr:ABC transporter ATP-binding protein [Gammaproteobacteria bacterium]MDH4314208.1 ABC transporter ATP-binding protein [Gammaproteobacteria bacterium]MDH5213239.1 ABC transporter ATP-binding protein [Gammaproteobacteria bacterium]
MVERSGISLRCASLTVSVPGRLLVSDLSFELRSGEFLAVLGQNGCGKTLTLQTLSGLRAPVSGSVSLHGMSVAAAHRKILARQLALLPQHTEDIFPSTVMETVMIGRHPHIGRFRWESELDRQCARNALHAVDLGELADRDLATLSGGERRRVAIAQILAQDPDVFLLDEPSNHLDPQHQLDVLRLFRKLSQSGKSVVASLHDVNLAARFADSCLLLHGDGRWQLGDTQSILSSASLSDLYATPVESVLWRDRQLFVAAGGGDESFR